MLGWEVMFFALVGLDSQRQTVLDAFEQMASAWPEVRECHMIRGGGDFMLKVVARDTAHENELTQRLTGAPNVTRVTTLQMIRTGKDVAGVPIPRDCRDGFQGAYWCRPEAYLDAGVRSAISSFARLGSEELADGLARLREDLASDAWDRRHGALRERGQLDLGYRLVVAESA